MVGKDATTTCEQELVVDVACATLHSDSVLSERPEAILARMEVIAHVVASDTLLQVKDLPEGKTGKRSGIKRRVTPDSIMADTWPEKANSSVPEIQVPTCTKRSRDDPLDQGPTLEAEFLAAEVAAHKMLTAARIKTYRSAKPCRDACQVCGIARDRWTCTLPLYVNAWGLPIQVPGSFCSKECFEHI